MMSERAKQLVAIAERRHEAWLKTTPEGKATAALLAAAEKAGFANVLRACQVEVMTSGVHEGGEWKGQNFAYIAWEQELREKPDFVVPEKALERATAWLAKYAAKAGTGWTVRS